MAKKQLLKYDRIYINYLGENDQIKMGKEHEYAFIEKYR